MPLPTITSLDLELALQEALSGYPYPVGTREDYVREGLRDIRRCCANLSAEEVRTALFAATRTVIGDLAAREV